MDTVMVTYSCFYDTAELYTFCQPGVGSLVYQQRAPGFNATVPVLLNFTSDTGCWFNVRTGRDGVDGANSAMFSLASAERTTGRRTFGLEVAVPDTTSSLSSSTSLPTPTASSSSSSLSSSASEAPAPATTGSSNTGGGGDATGGSDADENTSAGGGGLSVGTSAGIGVGAGVGAMVLVAGAFWCWRRRRAAPGPGMMGGPYPQYVGGGGDAAWTAQYYGASPASKWPRNGELNSVNSPVEIASSGDRGGRLHHEMMA
ncbi:hypothetical protein MFIFM68171_08263 [Madurella fahalii]|uniref:Uncharacterized protein n=1 Tax=Madurella fahalii TaxID=1157608 RepID=A0ABQ0GJW4_9PEZI